MGRKGTDHLAFRIDARNVVHYTVWQTRKSQSDLHPKSNHLKRERFEHRTRSGIFARRSIRKDAGILPRTAKVVFIGRYHR